MKICVFGAGAIGGYLGARLALAGFPVRLIARGPHLAAIRERGLVLETGTEREVAQLEASDDARVFGPQDYLIITLKAHQIEESLPLMAPLLGPHTTVVTASNGLPYWYFREPAGPLAAAQLRTVDRGGRQWAAFGPGRALGCVVYPATEVVAPGVIRHEYGRRFPLGEPDGRDSERVHALSEAIERAGLEAPVRKDIRSEIWLKLWGNLCLNPIAALTHATVDRIAGEPGTRALCRQMMSEAQALADRLQIPLRMDLERRLDGAQGIGAHKMSMLQDLERGRSLEVEPLVGVIEEIGNELGIPTPVTAVVLTLIRQRAVMAALEARAPGRADQAGVVQVRPY